MVAGAVLMFGSAGIFVLLGNSIIGLVAGSVVLGTGHLSTVVSQQAAVANTAGPGKFDTAFGHYTLAASLGQAIGPGLIVVAGGASAIPNTTGHLPRRHRNRCPTGRLHPATADAGPGP